MHATKSTKTMKENDIIVIIAFEKIIVLL